MKCFSAMPIPRFAFLLSFTVYLTMLFAEYLRPGFVSTAMNAHALWIPMIGFGMWDIFSDSRLEKAQKRSFAFFISTLLIGIILSLITWHIGVVFGDFRLLFALAVGILPSVTLQAVKK